MHEPLRYTSAQPTGTGTATHTAAGDDDAFTYDDATQLVQPPYAPPQDTQFPPSTQQTPFEQTLLAHAASDAHA